jgi:hypothetical protein
MDGPGAERTAPPGAEADRGIPPGADRKAGDGAERVTGPTAPLRKLFAGTFLVIAVGGTEPRAPPGTVDIGLPG